MTQGNQYSFNLGFICGSRGGKDLEEIQSIGKAGRQRHGPSDYQRNLLEHRTPGTVPHLPHFAYFHSNSRPRNPEENEALAARPGEKQVPPAEGERVIAQA